MNGGLKSISTAALLAAAVSLGGVSAQAADLGGNCCADLEERVAELEATTVRKGNRNVSVRISGTVAVRSFWHDSDADDAIRSGKVIMDQDDGSTAFQITGNAAVNSDVSIGFRIDLDVGDSDVSDVSDDATNNAVNVDDVYLTVSSKTFGTIDAGRVDQAMDGINAISLADIADIQLDDSNFTAFLGDGFLSAGDIDGTDDEGGSIRYTSPTLAGFIVSASYGHRSVAEIAAEGEADGFYDGSDIWSVALRYAGEFGAFRVAAGIGYEVEQFAVDPAAADDDRERESLAGSVSVMHTPTGLFANFAAGDQFDTENDGDEVDKVEAWAVVAGVENKFIALGKTTIYGFYQDIEDDGDQAVNFGAGITQKIDAAAARWNLVYERFESVDPDVDDANVISTGLAISF